MILHTRIAVRLFTRTKQRNADPSHILNLFTQNLQSKKVSLTRILTGPERMNLLNLLNAECRRCLIRFSNLRRRRRYVSVLKLRFGWEMKIYFSCFNDGAS